MAAANARGGGGADFTSALYLGLGHASRELRPWASLTAGKPAALEAPSGAAEVAARVAALQGCEAGTLLPSTLHLFWDLFGVLAAGTAEIWTDAGAYPVARWGVERARGMGVPTRSFRHHDPEALRRALRRGGARAGRPVVVTDGFCPGCGRSAPLPEYLEAVRARGGLLVVDDTQALGIWGSAPGPGAPYGGGGGGSLRRWGIGGPDVLLGCSLAKALGVPVAVLSGGAAEVRGFEARSLTRVHGSPPSVAVTRAAERALAVNAARGDGLRRVLAERVRRLRRGLARLGIPAGRGIFPVQTVGSVPGADAAALHARLLDLGIRTVLHEERAGSGPLLSFVVTAAHTIYDIDLAVGAAARATRAVGTRSHRWNEDLSERCPARG